MTFGSLFAGIGGMDLGLERAGMDCRWQVEIDPYATRVLAKHWPHVRRHDDVRTFPPDDGTDWRVDLIAGGFPCQPVSAIAATAKRRRGTEDDRWMWPDFRCVVAIIRPAVVLIENVPGLISLGLGDVVRDDLECDGYTTDPWQRISAGGAGAPHIRVRVFLVAYRDGAPLKRRRILADLARSSKAAEKHPPEWEWSGGTALYRGPGNRRLGTHAKGWACDPGVVRVADGVSSRMDNDRIRGLGNAVVPQVAERIGRRIIEAASQEQTCNSVDTSSD